MNKNIISLDILQTRIFLLVASVQKELCLQGIGTDGWTGWLPWNSVCMGHNDESNEGLNDTFNLFSLTNSIVAW